VTPGCPLSPAARCSTPARHGLAADNPELRSGLPRRFSRGRRCGGAHVHGSGPSRGLLADRGFSGSSARSAPPNVGRLDAQQEPSRPRRSRGSYPPSGHLMGRAFQPASSWCFGGEGLQPRRDDPNANPPGILQQCRPKLHQGRRSHERRNLRRGTSLFREHYAWNSGSCVSRRRTRARDDQSSATECFDPQRDRRCSANLSLGRVRQGSRPLRQFRRFCHTTRAVQSHARVGREPLESAARCRDVAAQARRALSTRNSSELS